MQWSSFRRTNFSEKAIVLKKYMLLKRFLIWKSSCLEELPASKKCMFWIITNSEVVAATKQ